MAVRFFNAYPSLLASATHLDVANTLVERDGIPSFAVSQIRDHNNIPAIVIDGISSGLLYVDGNDAINWGQSSLKDNTFLNFTSLDWNIRLLYDSSQQFSVDYDHHQLLIGEGTPSIDWQNYQAYDQYTNLSIDWRYRNLYDSSQFSTFNWYDVKQTSWGDLDNNYSGTKINIFSIDDNIELQASIVYIDNAMTMGGPIGLADGTINFPCLNFQNDGDMGLSRDGDSVMNWSIGGEGFLQWSSTSQFNMMFASNLYLSWSNGDIVTGSPDVFLARAGVGVLRLDKTPAGYDGELYLGTIALNPLQTQVNGSTSGFAFFSEPFVGPLYKKVIIRLSSLTGTASYTFPVAFNYSPGKFVGLGVTGSVTSLTTTSVTVTGVGGSTGFIILEGY